MTGRGNLLLARLVRRILPAHRADWAAAIYSEAESLDPAQGRFWLARAVKGAVMQRFHDTSKVTVATIVTATTLVLFFEWHTDEPMVVLPVLLGAAFVSGFLAPRTWLAIGIVLGWTILAAHFVTSHWNMMLPRYQAQPPSTGDYLTMALLVLPTLGAAWAGSRASAALKPAA